MKYHIEKNTVQETLVIPLYGRKMCSELYPNLYRDETALRLMGQIDYDFSLLSEKSKSFMQQFGFLEAAMRQNDLAWEVPAGTDVVSALDVSVLQDRLLAPVLGIGDPRTSPRISFMGGVRPLAELQERVADGRDAVAFSMYPVTVGEMMAIADAGAVMPPKSTWFEPKLRSGLFVHAV